MSDPVKADAGAVAAMERIEDVLREFTEADVVALPVHYRVTPRFIADVRALLAAAQKGAEDTFTADEVLAAYDYAATTSAQHAAKVEALAARTIRRAMDVRAARAAAKKATDV